MNEQVVVVTGGASGIGRALCERFAADGARVVVSTSMGRARRPLPRRSTVWRWRATWVSRRTSKR